MQKESSCKVIQPDKVLLKAAHMESTVAINITAERLAKRMTITALARECGLTTKTIQNLEAGHGGNISSVVMVAVALGVPTATLFKDHNDR
jgi:transcriptional regulator with XRE-family HTH domain